jgi:rhomboid protease GluP
MTDADQGHTPAPMISAPPSAPPPAISFEDLVRSINAATPRPFVAPTLVAWNLLVFVIMVAMGVSPTEPTTASLVEWGANFGVKTVHGEWWRLVSHQFLHAGWLHLAINLYALLSFGLLFERLAGNVGFLMVYLVAGLSGGITRLYWDPYLVSVGASGSIFGIAGATMGFVFLRRDSLPANVRDKILKDVLVFLALNAFYGLKAEGIDHAAHVGGCLSGVICGMVLSQPLPLRTERRKGRNLASPVWASARCC